VGPMLTGRDRAFAVAVVRWGIATYNMLSYDRPWWAGISFLFSILEVNTGLICACVATLSPLTHVWFSHIRDWTSRKSFGGSSMSKASSSRPSRGHIEHREHAHHHEDVVELSPAAAALSRDIESSGRSESTGHSDIENYMHFSDVPCNFPGDHVVWYGPHGSPTFGETVTRK
jgi:hypothetical protein